MADERPPIWVQLTIEYLVTDSSGTGLIGIDDTFGVRVLRRLSEYYHLNATNFNGH